MPRCGVPARVQRAELFGLFPFAPLNAARSSQRDDPDLEVQIKALPKMQPKITPAGDTSETKPS